MDSNKRFYDLNAEKYSNEWYANETMLPSIREFIGLFTKQKPIILDLGCGPGHESKRLHDNGAQVVGIDYSNESIKIAKAKNKNIEFYEMSYFDIDSKLGWYDGVFSCSSLIHLNEKELQVVIQKILEILKTNGLFLVIYRIGKGQIVQNHDINGEKIVRTIEQYEKEALLNIFENNGYSFLQDGYLENSLKTNWDSIIFTKKKLTTASTGLVYCHENCSSLRSAISTPMYASPVKQMLAGRLRRTKKMHDIIIGKYTSIMH